MKHLYKVGMRRCYACKKILPLQEFGKVRTKPLGKGYLCKICSLIRLRAFKVKFDVRRIFIEKANFCCSKCNIHNDNYSFFDLDHIKPVRRGKNRKAWLWGKEQWNNLQVLCPNCHRIKAIIDKEF